MKKTKTKPPAKVFHYDLYGKRDEKYNFLNENSINSINWNELENKEPEFFFVKKDWGVFEKYEEGFKINDAFTNNNTGLNTEFDELAIKNSKSDAENVLRILSNQNTDYIINHFGFSSNKISKIEKAIADIKNNSPQIVKIKTKPFEEKFSIYTGKSNGIMGRPRHDIMKNFLSGENLGLISMRQYAYNVPNYCYTFLSKEIVTSRLFISNKGYCSAFPLYLYPDQETDGVFTEEERTPNLNQEIVNQISEKLGLTFVPEKSIYTPKAYENSPPMEGCPESLRDGVAEEATPYKTVTTINGKEIRRNFVENLPYNPKLKKLATGKRKEGILSEVLFWQQVHKRKFHKIDFDRQRIIGNYIVDFYVKTLGLVVEIDGSSHDDKVEYDAERQKYLEELGLVVYRIADIDVKRNLDRVMVELEGFVVEKFGVATTTEKPTPSRKTSGHPSKGGEFQEQEFQGQEIQGTEFAPIDILDYIYAVLHSPSYREKYKEFLKIDFPRVPYPKDKEIFWKLVNLGGEIRKLHLLESPKVNESITSYPINGDNKITRKLNKNDWEITNEENQLGRIWINDEQYFDNIPLIAWEFYIGGYQPAQKWLKDRRGRELSFEDIVHYQKIIVSLFETDRLMKEIDLVGVE